MAITIQQQPTSPNMANNDLLFVLTSNQITQPQFQYVMDVFESGSATLIQRVKQQPNPSGKGVFNVGQILTYQMESDNVWKTQGFATSSECNKLFTIKFGEQYASSSFATSSIYNGISNVSPASPAKSGSDFYNITDGLVDYPNAINFNFDSGSYYTEVSASVYNTFSYQHNLSNAPTTQYIQEGEYLTLAFYNGNMTPPSSDIVAQDIFYVQIDWRDADGNNLQYNDFTNDLSNGGAPRSTSSELWSAVAGQQTPNSRLIHIGLGVQNLEDKGITPPSGWAYYTAKITGQGDDGLENADGVWADLRFNKSVGECSYNGVRFAWKNEFGVWDYYTFTLQSDANSDVERLTYEHTFVPYNTTENSAVYDKTRRGTTPFVNKVVRRQTANSSWLTQAEADWLRELFFSTNVFIQNGSDFEPIAITSANVVEKTNPRTQKVFQYQIAFEQANNLRSRK